jgi:hypothetical protein
MSRMGWSISALRATTERESGARTASPSERRTPLSRWRCPLPAGAGRVRNQAGLAAVAYGVDLGHSAFQLFGQRVVLGERQGDDHVVRLQEALLAFFGLKERPLSVICSSFTPAKRSTPFLSNHRNRRVLRSWYNLLAQLVVGIDDGDLAPRLVRYSPNCSPEGSADDDHVLAHRHPHPGEVA